MTTLMLNKDFIGTRLLSLIHPDLDHHIALDFCASRLASGEQPAIVFSSSALLAHEMLKRFSYREVALVTRGDWDESVLQTSLLHRNTSATPFRVFRLGTLTLTSPHLLWAEPLNQDTVQTAIEIRKHLAPSGVIYVITTGRIARFQAYTRNNPHSTIGAAGLIQSVHLLRQAGLRVREIVGFHPPAAIAWGLASRAASRAGRADLADRWLVRMRRAFVSAGWSARLSTVNVIVATLAA